MAPLLHVGRSCRHLLPSLFARHALPSGSPAFYAASDGSFYTGITNDLPKRLKAHAAGKGARYTRCRLPVALAYSEPQKSKSAALKREAAIKKLSRPRKDRLLSSKPTRRHQSAV